MKRLIYSTRFGAWFVAGWCAAGSVWAGTVDLPDDVSARIARAKSEQSVLASERARSKLDGDAGSGTNASGGGLSALGNGCSIAIGNVFEDSKRIGTSAKKETTVIVTGDIIQAGNNCK